MTTLLILLLLAVLYAAGCVKRLNENVAKLGSELVRQGHKAEERRKDLDGMLCELLGLARKRRPDRNPTSPSPAAEPEPEPEPAPAPEAGSLSEKPAVVARRRRSRP